MYIKCLLYIKKEDIGDFENVIIIFFLNKKKKKNWK